MSEHDVWSRQETVGRITFDRPDRLNAWTPAMGEAVLAALQGPASDPEVRAVVITGAGRAFSAGADLSSWEDEGNGMPDIAPRMRDIWNPLILAIRELPKPVVTQVNGPAAGYGASVVLASDFALMGHSAFLQLAFSQVGLMPDGGSSFFLPAAVGRARAARIAMLGERVSADLAVEWGLAHSAHPDGELTDFTADFAGKLAAGPTQAYAATKTAFNRAATAGLADQLVLEAERQQALMATADFAEGTNAFMEKRKPAFAGH